MTLLRVAIAVIACASAAVLSTTAFSADAIKSDIVLDNQVESMKKAGVGPVRFTHAKHSERTKCAVCHPKIFVDKEGANPISMKANMEQKFCGSPNCHNSKAFPLFNCANCHSDVKKVK